MQQTTNATLQHGGMIFYAALLQEFPDYNIIEILPVENVSQIEFKAPTFYSNEAAHENAQNTPTTFLSR
jgi:hypothetical protein